MFHAQSLLFRVWSDLHTSLLLNPYLYFLLRDAEATTPRHERLFGRVAEINTLTDYEPKDLIEVNDTEVLPMFFHRPSMTSTCVSAESIATPPLESDLDDQQIRDMLTYERERSKCRVKNLTSDTVDISLAHWAVQGEDEALSRLSESENKAKLFLEEERNQLLSQAARMPSRFCRMNWKTNSVQSYEIDHTNLGYEQSRREQVRLHEEFPQRERALREIHVRNIHEVEELKKVQEMRIDECSKQALRESQTTKKELTSQIHRVNSMNDSREFQAVESIWSGGLSTFRVKRQLFQVLVVCRAATKACDLTWGIRLLHRVTFLTIHLHQSTQCRHRTGWSMLHSVTQCSQAQGDL